MKEKPCADCGASFIGRRSRCPPCYGKFRWATSPAAYSSERDLPRYRRHHLKKSYGITHEDYQRMLDDQAGGCALCGTTACSTGKRLAVDHDHATGKVRALLCACCNTAIGKLQDSPALLRKAADYLEFHRMTPQTPS